jgi:hypothetical protein
MTRIRILSYPFETSGLTVNDVAKIEVETSAELAVVMIPLLIVFSQSRLDMSLLE